MQYKRRDGHIYKAVEGKHERPNRLMTGEADIRDLTKERVVYQ